MASPATRHRGKLPAIYQTGYVDMGGLLSYSANFDELARQSAVYVDKVLKGAKPADCLSSSQLDLNCR
jgi:ABC-type uncharacterized transport system substrate-binding protein